MYDLTNEQGGCFVFGVYDSIFFFFVTTAEKSLSLLLQCYKQCYSVTVEGVLLLMFIVPLLPDFLRASKKFCCALLLVRATEGKTKT